jgi:hypothetical protein
MAAPVPHRAPLFDRRVLFFARHAHFVVAAETATFALRLPIAQAIVRAAVACGLRVHRRGLSCP